MHIVKQEAHTSMATWCSGKPMSTDHSPVSCSRLMFPPKLSTVRATCPQSTTTFTTTVIPFMSSLQDSLTMNGQHKL